MALIHFPTCVLRNSIYVIRDLKMIIQIPFLSVFFIYFPKKSEMLKKSLAVLAKDNLSSTYRTKILKGMKKAKKETFSPLKSYSPMRLR